MLHPSLRRTLTLLLFTILAAGLSGGCADNATVILKIFLNANGNRVPTGDGIVNGDGADTFKTPDDMAIGIRSAKLTGPDGASHTLFEREDDAPMIVRLDVSSTFSQATSLRIPLDEEDLADGTYDALELEIVFYEAAILIHDGMAPPDPDTRRLRVYFDDYNESLDPGGSNTDDNRTIEDNDMLISFDDFTPPEPGIYEKNAEPEDPNTDGLDLRWVQRAIGDLCAAPPTPTDPDSDHCTAAVYQGDPGQFTGYPMVTIDLPSDIVVDSDTDEAFTIMIELGIEDLFFFDDTESTSDDEFNFLNSGSDDGTIEATCIPADCSDNDTADFWLEPPDFDVDLES